MVVRNRIQYWRQRLGKTRTQFAAMIETHPAQISRWEHHEVQPSVEKYHQLWVKLQQHFPEVHLEDLMESVSEDQPESVPE